MPAVIRVTAESSLATLSANVWHWIIPNSAPVTEANNAVDALDTFYTAIATHLATQTFTIGQRVVTVDQSPNQVISPTVETAAGTGGTPEVLSAAAVLRLSSNFVGGSFRGRVFLGPLASNVVTSAGNVITSTTVTAVTAAAATLMGTTTGGIQLAVWSRRLNQATPITGVSCSSRVGTQRRRLT